MEWGICSVSAKHLKRLDVAFFVSEKPEELGKADGLILPGVGAFKDAMVILNESGISDFIQDYVKTGKPLIRNLSWHAASV